MLKAIGAGISSIRAWITILVLLIGGPFVVLAGFSESRDMAKLKDHGKEAVAQVDQVQWKEKRLSGTEKNFKVDVHFETEAHDTVQAKLSVDKALGQRLRDGTAEPTIKVRYLPEDPHTVYLADAGDSSGGMYAIGAVMFAVGAFMLYRRTKKPAAAGPVAA